MRAPLYSSNPSELFEPAAIADPQRLYARLRSEAPLARVAETGVHLVATWDLVEEALSREADFSARLTGVLMRDASGGPAIFELITGNDEIDVLATADEPRHAVHRAVVQPRFAGALVTALEERVRAWARAAVRERLAGGAGDFVPVAEIVPAQVVGEVLGLPEGDASRFRTWAMIGGELLAGNLGETQLVRIAGEAVKMAAYLGEHLDRAGEDLRHDRDAPLMHFLAAGVKEGRISRGAAVVIASTLFSAGGESTAALIGNLVRRLAERPEIANALRGSRDELIPQFAEEVARLDAPFNFHYRLVQRDCELAGFELEELLDATDSIGLRAGADPVYANSIMVRRLEHLFLDAHPHVGGQRTGTS